MSTPCRLRILVIDDDEVLLATTEALLAAADYAVETHHGAFGASAAIMKSRPDLVLLDVNMPGLSGPALAELVRARTWGERMRILFYSSSEAEELARAVAASGADGFVRKGDRASLLAEVARALGKGSAA